MNSLSIMLRSLRRGVGVSAVLLVLGLSGSVASASPALSKGPEIASAALSKGSEIDASGCEYGPGQIVAGNKTGQYFGDPESFYALTFVPSGVPGGHFRFTGQYPKAAWFAFQSADVPTMGTQGVLDDVNVPPDPGSVNPYRPGQSYEPSKDSYTVDVRDVPPAQRQSPPTVLYAGYRGDPRTGGLIHTPGELLLYAVEGATDRSLMGGAPLPKLYWVVDDPSTNLLTNTAEVCAAMQVAGQPLSTVFRVNKTLDQYIWSPIEEPTFKHVDIPDPFDPIPNPQPDVSVFRPSPNGYWLPLFNQQAAYVFSGPSALFGRFIVIRFKAPTFSRVEDGIPRTGTEQTQYWGWCATQGVSMIFITTGCLIDHQAHPDANGYVTLVVSPKDERPVIDGKPYADWLEWPGSGIFLFMDMFDSNPVTFPQSPYSMPQTSFKSVPYMADWLPGTLFESQIKARMGDYYPHISYCTTAQFEDGTCT